MKRRRGTFWRRRNGGLTLVEALVGTAILGTVLVSVLVADGRLRRQASFSEDHIEACRIADAFLAEWWPTVEEPNRFPRQGSGEFFDRPGWSWRTEIIPHETAEQLKAEVISLEIFSPKCTEPHPAVHVEIMLPQMEKSGDASEGNDTY
ncbi:MAG: prepilin-type N-terminal cleavage/methylation domain-containing protein [Phycisphaerae bacterium]|nr:prepilin-type N-terminal cleavage/methylation domain-containing protein [Phycisphaerae bacterium]